MHCNDKPVLLDDAELDAVTGGGAVLGASVLLSAVDDVPLCGTRFPGWRPIPVPGPIPVPVLGVALRA